MAEDSPRSELLELVRAARALVAWEETIGGDGFPSLTIAEETTRTHEGRSFEPSTEPSPASKVLPTPPSRSREESVARLQVIAEQAASCTRCVLSRERTHCVFARGNPHAEIAFVGEGPGYHEDQSGLPFVGPAGQLLDRMITAMGYGRDDVYICNVVKCRPPENRTPLPDEAAACAPFLEEQLTLVAPKVIVALGRCATENLGVVPPGARGWRGEWRAWKEIPVMPTYHPAFLLRSPEYKRPVWEDLQKVLAKLGRTAPKRTGA